MTEESEISARLDISGLSEGNKPERNYGEEIPPRQVPPEVVYAFARHTGHLLKIPETDEKDSATLDVLTCYLYHGDDRWPPTEDDLSNAVAFMEGRGVRKKAQIYKVPKGFSKDKPLESGYTLVCKPDAVEKGGLVDRLMKIGGKPTDLLPHIYFLSSQRIGGAKREMKRLGLERQIIQKKIV